jgi:hypothetical protein
MRLASRNCTPARATRKLVPAAKRARHTRGRRARGASGESRPARPSASTSTVVLMARVINVDSTPAATTSPAGTWTAFITPAFPASAVRPE